MSAKKKVTKKKALKKPVAKKAVKKAAKKAPAKKTAKKAPVTSIPPSAPMVQTPKPGLTDSNGDPLGGVILNHDAPVEASEKASKTPKGTEIDTSKGGVSIRAKKTKAEAAEPGAKKSYTVVMRGGVPTKVEDSGDDL